LDDYSILDDRVLYEKLEKAGLADRLETQPEWKLLKEGSERIIERAIAEFALKTKADDIVRIIELQTIIKKYKYGLFEEIKWLVQEGELIFEEGKNRGILQKHKTR